MAQKLLSLQSSSTNQIRNILAAFAIRSKPKNSGLSFTELFKWKEFMAFTTFFSFSSYFNFEIMITLMLRARYHLKIFWTIVSSIFINMVDNFLRKGLKGTIKFLFHYITVLKTSLTVYKNNTVAITIQKAFSTFQFSFIRIFPLGHTSIISTEGSM